MKTKVNIIIVIIILDTIRNLSGYMIYSTCCWYCCPFAVFSCSSSHVSKQSFYVKAPQPPHPHHYDMASFLKYQYFHPKYIKVSNMA